MESQEASLPVVLCHGKSIRNVFKNHLYSFLEYSV